MVAATLCGCSELAHCHDVSNAVFYMQYNHFVTLTLQEHGHDEDNTTTAPAALPEVNSLTIT
jgi:hypothetical protein